MGVNSLQLLVATTGCMKPLVRREEGLGGLRPLFSGPKYPLHARSLARCRSPSLWFQLPPTAQDRSCHLMPLFTSAQAPGP